MYAEQRTPRKYDPSTSAPPLPQTLAVELASLDIDAILPNRHAQILHGQNRAVLAPALATATIPRPLDAQRCAARSRRAFPLVLGAAGRHLPNTTLLSWDGEAGGRAERAHGVVGVGIARADPRVLVRVRRDVGDELLGREGEEAREARVGLGRRWEAGLCHVVVGDGVGDLAEAEG